MLIFYIIFGCLIFALSGLIIQFNRLAIYRRRIIRNLADSQQKNKQQVINIIINKALLFCLKNKSSK